MNLDHLSPSAAAMIERSIEERLKWLEEDAHWIGYGRAVEALNRLDALLTMARTDRMPSMLICGPTNNGKTRIIRRFLLDHPITFINGGEATSMPIVMINCPHGPYTRGFLVALVRALGLGGLANRSGTFLEGLVLEVMAKVGVKLLIVDDIHHIFSPRDDLTQQCLNLLRSLSNNLKISIVVLGVRKALKVMQTDDGQTANRFHPLFLPKWTRPKDHEEYLSLLDSFEQLLPLEEPSDLSSPEIARFLLSRSDGLIGEMWTILRNGAAAAWREDKRRLDLDLLQGLDYTAPSRSRYMDIERKEGLVGYLT